MAEQKPFKEGIDAKAVKRIADSLIRVYPDFPKSRFVKKATSGLATLELKERVVHVISVLHECFPGDFKKTAAILLQLKTNWIPPDPNDNLGGLAAWPIIDYVGKYGLDDPELSLQVLEELTGLFSAEFAIRPFIIQHTEPTLGTLKKWCTHSDEHVKRLVSEGSRPRLPWGCRLPQFIADPSPVIPLLEELKDDPSEYVRRSVANNLNDISKDHPELVVELCSRWQKGASDGTKWIIRHATRTLVKTGYPGVFGLLGYTTDPQLELISFEVVPKTIKLGDKIEFKAILKSTGTIPQKVVVDYAVHHMKANGKTSPKVFKFRNLDIDAGKTVVLNRRHAIKPVTTRRYYPGRHVLEILINGKTFGQGAFTLRL